MVAYNRLVVCSSIFSFYCWEEQTLNHYLQFGITECRGFAKNHQNKCLMRHELCFVLEINQLKTVSTLPIYRIIKWGHHHSALSDHQNSGFQHTTKICGDGNSNSGVWGNEPMEENWNFFVSGMTYRRPPFCCFRRLKTVCSQDFS